MEADDTFQQKREQATQQGIHESYYCDMTVMFGKWEFDHMELSEPPCPVQLWQGDEGIHESYYCDMTVMFGKWEFDHMEMSEPPCPVQLWQGDEDGLVPVVLQRYLASKIG